MKKLFFTFAAIVLACGFANAESFKLVEGDLSFLKEVRELAAELTWNGTLIGEMTEQEYVDSKQGEKEDFEEYKRKWYEEDRMSAWTMLNTSFTNSLKKRSCVVIDASSRYKFVFNVDKIDLGFAGVGLVSKGTLMWATISVVDTATGETVAVIQADECKTATSYVMAATKAIAFDNLGNKTAKWLVKQKYVCKK